MVRLTQKLQSQMVMLTIAISGGPFLGLLGTVVGVMITFAAIAASGDVNVNSIAPGIAAALAATVAGSGGRDSGAVRLQLAEHQDQGDQRRPAGVRRRVRHASRGALRVSASAEEKDVYDEINITPMLDLAYVLLVIFIIMTTASVQGITVNLPKASETPAIAKPKTKAVSITADGTIYLDTYPVVHRRAGAAADSVQGRRSGAAGDHQGRLHHPVPEGDRCARRGRATGDHAAGPGHTARREVTTRGTAPSQRFRRLVPVLAGAVVVAIVVAGLIWLIVDMQKTPDGPKRQVAQVVQLVRPPPPPPEPPPPPPPPEEKIEEPLEQETPEEAPPDESQAPEQLGLDAEGVAGGDSFGLAASKGGRDLVGTGGAAFAWYTSSLKDRILNFLSDDERIRKGKYQVTVSVGYARTVPSSR